MRKIAILIVAGLMAVASAAWGTVVFFPKVSSGTSCSLLSSDFEGESDGTDLTAISDAWTNAGSAADEYEVDTAQYHGGSASAKIYIWGGSSENMVYKTHTAQNSTYSVKFWLRWTAGTGTGSDAYNNFIALTDGAFSWSSTITVTLTLYNDDGSLKYHNGSTWVDTGIDISENTWTEIEIISDLTTDTFDLKVNGSTVVNDGSMKTSGLSPDRIYLRDYTGVNDCATIWIDDLCIN